MRAGRAVQQVGVAGRGEGGGGGGACSIVTACTLSADREDERIGVPVPAVRSCMCDLLFCENATKWCR